MPPYNDHDLRLAIRNTLTEEEVPDILDPAYLERCDRAYEEAKTRSMRGFGTTMSDWFPEEVELN